MFKKGRLAGLTCCKIDATKYIVYGLSLHSIDSRSFGEIRLVDGTHADKA